jgi:UDP-3-O-[3-hydroxymyristoyl] glucosamine N-acyltransferase
MMEPAQSAAKTRTAQQIAERLGALAGGLAAAQTPTEQAPAGFSDRVLQRVSALEDADPASVVFAQDDAALHAALDTQAGLILARRGSAGVNDDRVLWVGDPKYCFAVCAQEFCAPPQQIEVHPTAFVDPTASLGDRVSIGAHAVVEEGVVLGDDVVIASGARVLRGVRIGRRVIVQAGAVLGSTGFGYVRNRETGEYLLFPQQGQLVVEDDVEIGANSTIDRGALGETRIGKGTKIDNLVHIGHNCRIGRNVVIAAQVGISGSCVVEDGAVLAGQVGISDHCHIGPGVILGGQAGVFRGKAVTGPGEAFAGTPAEPIKEYLKSIARVRRLK